MIEFSLTEMVLISANITAIARNARRISRSENSKLNWVSLQDAGGLHFYDFRSQSFYSSLCFALIFGVESLTCSPYSIPARLVNSTNITPTLRP